MTYSAAKHKFKELEAFSAAHPRAYLRNVRLLAAAGLVYVFLVGILLVLAVPLFFWLAFLVWYIPKIALMLALVGFAFGASAFTTFAAIFQRIPTPEGYPVTLAEYPRLHALIDEVRATVGVPVLDKILLTNEFNAAIVQTPRLGMVGPYVNYLILGVPYLLILSPADLKTIIGHEMAHLAGAHGKTGHWVYRLRATWNTLAARLGNHFAFRPLYHWYAPYFSRYSIVHARQNEYEADAVSARVTSPREAVDALTRSGLLMEAYAELNEEWTRRQLRECAAPPIGYLEEVRQQREAIYAEAFTEKKLALLARPRTELYDSHPCLRDRAAALGTPVQLPAVPTVSAAEEVFEPDLDPLIEKLDLEWRQRVEPPWALEHKNRREKDEALRTLETTRAAGAPLTVEQLWQRASFTEYLYGSQTALPAYRELLAAHPADNAARFQVGRILLRQGDAAGEQEMKESMTKDPSLSVDAFQILHGYHSRYGDEAMLDRINEELNTSITTRVAAEQERQHHSERDTWMAPTLSEELVQRIRACFETDEYVGLLVRKQVRHYQESACHVLFIYPVKRKPKALLVPRLEAMVKESTFLIDGAFNYIFINDEDRAKVFRRKGKKVPGAIWIGATPPPWWKEHLAILIFIGLMAAGGAVLAWRIAFH